MNRFHHDLLVAPHPSREWISSTEKMQPMSAVAPVWVTDSLAEDLVKVVDVKMGM